MYAVIATGGKQERVAEGQVLDVERLGLDDGEAVTFTPVLLVDGDDVLAGEALGGATVSARVVGESKGPKITGISKGSAGSAGTKAPAAPDTEDEG